MSDFDPVLEWARAIGKPLAELSPAEVVAAKLFARQCQQRYVQDDEAIALLRKALMTAERPDEAAMGFETDGFLADEIKAFFSRRGISGER